MSDAETLTACKSCEYLVPRSRYCQAEERLIFDSYTGAYTKQRVDLPTSFNNPDGHCKLFKEKTSE